MPYPAKLTSETILEAALTLVERGGPDALSMRPLAELLDVRPSSLYRYFPEREALLGALEARAARDLHAAILRAAHALAPEPALEAAAQGYLAYAREHPHLYSLLLRTREPDAAEQVAEPDPGKALWNTVLGLVGAVTGHPDDTAATVAFWAYLHGFVLLERSGQFGRSGPQGGFERGLGALIRGLGSDPRA